MIVVGGVLFGLCCAVVAQFLAFVFTGAGHGWVTPFFLSGLLWFAYPLVIVRAGLGRSRSRTGCAADWITLIGAVLSNVFLILQTLTEGEHYFWTAIDGLGLPFFIMWLATWLGWQVIAATRVWLGRPSLAYSTQTGSPTRATPGAATEA